MNEEEEEQFGRKKDPRLQLANFDEFIFGEGRKGDEESF
jgi:hypothetical protein